MTKYKEDKDEILWNEDIMPICKVTNWVNLVVKEEDIEEFLKSHKKYGMSDLGFVFPFKGENIEIHLKIKEKAKK